MFVKVIHMSKPPGGLSNSLAFCHSEQRCLVCVVMADDENVLRVCESMVELCDSILCLHLKSSNCTVTLFISPKLIAAWLLGTFNSGRTKKTAQKEVLFIQWKSDEGKKSCGCNAESGVPKHFFTFFKLILKHSKPTYWTPRMLLWMGRMIRACSHPILKFKQSISLLFSWPSF